MLLERARRSSGRTGPVAGITWMTPVSTVGFGVPALTRHDAVELGDAVADRLEVAEHVGGLGDVDREHERAVAARAELLGDRS